MNWPTLRLERDEVKRGYEMLSNTALVNYSIKTYWHGVKAYIRVPWLSPNKCALVLVAINHYSLSQKNYNFK